MAGVEAVGDGTLDSTLVESFAGIEKLPSLLLQAVSEPMAIAPAKLNTNRFDTLDFQIAYSLCRESSQTAMLCRAHRGLLCPWHKQLDHRQSWYQPSPSAPNPQKNSNRI